MALTKIGKEGITGIDNSSDATAITIDSNERVMVGKTSTGLGNVGVELDPEGQLKGTAADVVVQYLNRTSSDGAIAEFRKDNTTVGAVGARGGDIYIATGDTGIRAYDQQDAILPVGTDGASRDNAIDLGIGSIRFKNLNLSGGVYLGGTGSDNYLQDYETGAWTPSYVGSTTDPTVSYGLQKGFYTKIGKIVHIQGRIRTTSKSGGSGNLRIAGLPFVSISNTQSYSAVNIPWSNGFGTNGHPSSCYVRVGASDMQLIRFSSSDPRGNRVTGITTADMSTGVNENDVMYAGTYMTDS